MFPSTARQHPPAAFCRVSDTRCVCNLLCACGCCAYVQAWDPTLHQWATRFDLAGGSRMFAASVVVGNVVWVCGGQDAGGVALSTCETSTDGGAWVLQSSALHVPRSHFVLAVVGNGTLLALGGCNGTQCESPGAASAATNNATDTIEIYNAATGVWDVAPNLRLPRATFDMAATTTSAFGGGVLVMGGRVSVTSWEASRTVYVVTLGGVVTDLPHAPVLPIACAGGTVVPYAPGAVVLVGAMRAWAHDPFVAGPFIGSEYSFVFDLSRGTFRDGPKSPWQMHEYTAFALADGTMLFAGGFRQAYGTPSAPPLATSNISAFLVQ